MRLTTILAVFRCLFILSRTACHISPSRTVIATVPKGPRALPAVQLLTALPEGAVAPLNVNGALAFSHVCQLSHPIRIHKKTRFRGLGLQQLR